MNSRYNQVNDLRAEIYKYISFWPYYLLTLVLFVLLSLVYLRYADYLFLSKAKIEIIDKAQDSEMALPTAMTIFNRSMINLENEIGVLTSFKLHSRVVNRLDSNVLYFTDGKVKSTQNQRSNWFKDYNIDFKVNTDTILTPKYYKLTYSNQILEIEEYDDKDELTYSIDFKSLNTKLKKHSLPFDLVVFDDILEFQKSIYLNNIDFTIDNFVEQVEISISGSESEQLNISFKHSNKLIANEYLSTLISEFDMDGITDRQSEYKRTMEFVDSRSTFLAKELEIIEQRKQSYKEENRLTNVIKDAEVNVMQSISYDSELFKATSQRDLALMLLDVAKQNNFDLMPVNIGLENENINNLIIEYNNVIKNRNKFLISAGTKNAYVNNLEKEIISISKNISFSIENYLSSLNKLIDNIESKEKEFETVYATLPEKEKILRKIERELEVKESLFLLLLQKREEAAINYAVVKPSIKIIDPPRNSYLPVSPRPLLIIVGTIVAAFFLMTAALYLWFFLDDKIHTKAQILELIDVPVIAEIPSMDSSSKFQLISSSTSRNKLAEGVRMITANLNYLIDDVSKKDTSNVILVTSSIKGEGKTLISSNLSSILTSKSKNVCLIGADLRNPQIHKLINKEKSMVGLSNYIYNDDIKIQDIMVNYEKIDIILSGPIPPNPTEMLSSVKFKKLVESLKNSYDYIIIDTAPCILVSDTFEIAKLADICLYIVRANYTKIDLLEFIKGCKNGKLPKLNIVLNDVGKSGAYGYKYGYQYGYQYAYNYGYEYGYAEEKRG